MRRRVSSGPRPTRTSRRPSSARGLDGDFVALVGHERADGEEEALARPVAGLKVVDVHRRVADLGLAAVVAEDSRRDRRRVGEVASRPPGRGHVPGAQTPDRGGLESPKARPSRRKVEIELLVRVADGRVAVGEVRSAVAGDRSLGHAVRRGDDEVEAREIEGLDRLREERQIVSVVRSARRAGG